MSQYKAIIFDLDNTLINRQKAAYNFYKDIVSELFVALKVDEIEIEARVQDLMNWDEYGNIPKTHPFTMLCNKYGLNKELVPLLDYRWTKHIADYTLLFDDTIEVLDYLKDKYQLALMTNGDSNGQWAKINKVNLKPYFNQILVSGDLNIHKPDSRIYRKMLQELNLEAHECLFVGDIFTTDIIGAHRIKMPYIWFVSDKTRPSSSNITRISRLSELKEIL